MNRRCIPLLRRSLFPTFVLLVAAPLSAQLAGGQWETILRIDGPTPLDQLGYCVSGAGDVNGDGFDDVIVGSGHADPGGLTYAGSAYVYSGATGGVIWQFHGQAPGDNLGHAVADAGDVDGDGFGDVIVGAFRADPGGLQDAGSVFVYSGASGTLLHQFDGYADEDWFGNAVAGAGDVDGDGFDDVIIGAIWADPGGIDRAGSAYVYSGATGNLIWKFDGQGAIDLLGFSVSGAGDVDGDGFDDVIAGAYYANTASLVHAGSAYVYSGATGGLIWKFDGNESHDSLGHSVSGAGDVDRDGFDDLAIAARDADPGGLVDAGSVYVYSGATGGLIWQFDGRAAGDRLGCSVSGAGDVDGDGVADLVGGAYYTTNNGRAKSGSAFIASGATGALIRRINGLMPNGELGRSVSGAGDFDGDGLADLIVGAPRQSPGGLSRAGSVYVISLDPFLTLDASELSASSSSTVQLDLKFPVGEAGAAYAVLASFTGTGPIWRLGLKIPLTQDHLFQLFMSGNVPAVLQGGLGTLDANSMAVATLSAGPGLAPAVGRTIHFAAITYDSVLLTGRMCSIARYLRIVP